MKYVTHENRKDGVLQSYGISCKGWLGTRKEDVEYLSLKLAQSDCDYINSYRG